MDGVDLTDANCYATAFDGASLRNAQVRYACPLPLALGAQALASILFDTLRQHFVWCNAMTHILQSSPLAPHSLRMLY